MAIVVPAPLAASLTETRPPAVADVARAGVCDTIVKGGERRERLDSGGGNELTGDRAVHERVRRFVGRERVPIVLGDAAHEQLGLESGGAGHGDNLAVGNVDHAGGTGLAALDTPIALLLDNPGERFLGNALHVDVDGQHNVTTSLRRDGGRVVGHVAVNIDVDCLLATDSLEHLLVLILDTSLAGGVTGLVRDTSVRGLGGVDLILRHGAGIPK